MLLLDMVHLDMVLLDTFHICHVGLSYTDRAVKYELGHMVHLEMVLLDTFHICHVGLSYTDRAAKYELGHVTSPNLYSDLLLPIPRH